MIEDQLEILREIRTKQDLQLKPSPFLRDSYYDEFGEERKISLRNYQKTGVMNLLVSLNTCLADDCGLGKTLQVLTAIGYVWLKEPEYVPIIITPKSPLFQWAAETKRFMQNMDAVVASGGPIERQKAYSEFFDNYEQDKKRILLVTYDAVMRDCETSVIRNKGFKPAPGAKKALAEHKNRHKDILEVYRLKKEILSDHFNIMFYETETFIKHYVQSDPFARPSIPTSWPQDSADILRQLAEAHDLLKDSEARLKDLNDAVTPPKVVPGILDYMKTLKELHPHVKFMLIMDEVHKLKNHKSQFHLKVQEMSLLCDRIYGMTATPVQNRLMEFFSIFRIIVPGLFSKITHFQNEYCVMKLQRISGGRQVPIVVGYKNLDSFVRKIEPYYLSRKKHEVAKELPELISVEVECELHETQQELYDLAEIGVIEKDSDPDSNAADMLSAMTMCRQAVDSPNLILNEEGEIYEGTSCKIDSILNILEEQANEKKVIIFSNFEKMITVMEERFKEEKIKYVRITGKENNPKIREEAKNKFQDMKSGFNVILITTAGAESLNLQAAEHFIFIDLPWSAGTYFQLIGRMVRIGSSHNTVTAHHLLAVQQSGKKTIDHHVLAALRSKKKLIDKVAGDSLVGAFKFQDSDMSRDVLSMMLKDQKEKKDRKDKKLATAAQKLSSKKPLEPEPKIIEIHSFSADDF